MANEIIKYEQLFEKIRGVITILPLSEFVQSRTAQMNKNANIA